MIVRVEGMCARRDRRRSARRGPPYDGKRGARERERTREVKKKQVIRKQTRKDAGEKGERVEGQRKIVDLESRLRACLD